MRPNLIQFVAGVFIFSVKATQNAYTANFYVLVEKLE